MAAELPYPTDLAGRKAKRAANRRRLIAEAEAKTQRTGRSLTCAESLDHSTCIGGGWCLCECHDPAEVTQ